MESTLRVISVKKVHAWNMKISALNLEARSAYHLSKKSGNFGLKSNGKVIFRNFRSEIVEHLVERHLVWLACWFWKNPYHYWMVIPNGSFRQMVSTQEVTRFFALIFSRHAIRAISKKTAVRSVNTWKLLRRSNSRLQTTSSPSFALSVVRDANENREEKMVAWNPGDEKHAKGG